MRPIKFKLGTPVDNGWMYRVYQNQAVAAYWFLYFFIFLSVQLLNINFCHTFLKNCEPGRLKHGTHMDSGQMYHVYQNQAAAYMSHISSIFFLSNFQTLNIFVALSSETVRPRKF